MNSTRWALTRAIEARGFPTKTSTGGRTKYNRTQFAVPKAHALDALCVGDLTAVTGWPATTLTVTCTGRGTYQRAHVDKHGFPRKNKAGTPAVRSRTKVHHGFQTGDLVRAVVPTGKKKGTHVGRIGVRATGSMLVGKTDGINHKHIRRIQRADGYAYQTTPTVTKDET